MISTTTRPSRCVAIATLLLTSTTIAAFPGTPLYASVLPRAAAADNAKDSPVFKAVAEGSAEKLTAALASGEDVNGTDKNGKTALMLASSMGRTDLVQALLNKGALVNQTDTEGRTALHYVLAGTNPEPPKKKRGFGGFMDKAKNIGGKALTLVSSSGMLSYLIPGGPLLQNLAQGMMGKGLPGLMGPGASFGLGNSGAWSGVLGSALMSGGAGKNGASPVLASVDSILGKNVDPATTASSWTTLLSSANNKEPGLLKAMSNLGSGAAPSESAAWTKFLETAQSGDTAALQTMVSDPAFAPVLAKATSGLHAAANQLPGRDGGEGIVLALIARGADTTLADKNGITPLQRARNAKLEVVIRLLETPSLPPKASLK